METLEIAEPCKLKYSRMTKVNGGRHCDSCDKVVVDFRKMNSSEVSSYLKDRCSENVCGKFSREQINTGSRLDRWLNKQKIKAKTRSNKLSFPFLFLILISWVMSLSSCMGKAVSKSPAYKDKTANNSSAVEMKK